MKPHDEHAEVHGGVEGTGGEDVTEMASGAACLRGARMTPGGGRRPAHIRRHEVHAEAGQTQGRAGCVCVALDGLRRLRLGWVPASAPLLAGGGLM